MCVEKVKTYTLKANLLNLCQVYVGRWVWSVADPEMFVALGKPFLDIIAKIDGERIQKYQFENYDHVRFDHKILDDDLKDIQKIYKLGGSITNTLRTIKWISPNLNLLFIGNIGEDANGKILKRQIEEEEIRTHFWVTKVNTAKCYVLIHGDVRTLVTDSETKRSIEVDLDESLFINASILYLSVCLSFVNMNYL